MRKKGLQIKKVTAVFTAAALLFGGLVIGIPEPTNAADSTQAVESVVETDLYEPTTAGKPGKVKITQASSIGGGYVQVKWKPLTENCEGYVVEICDQKKFPESRTMIEECGPSEDHLNIGVGVGTKIFIRIKAYNFVDGKCVYGKYSKTVKIKAKK